MTFPCALRRGEGWHASHHQTRSSLPRRAAHHFLWCHQENTVLMSQNMYVFVNLLHNVQDGLCCNHQTYVCICMYSWMIYMHTYINMMPHAQRMLVLICHYQKISRCVYQCFALVLIRHYQKISRCVYQCFAHDNDYHIQWIHSYSVSSNNKFV